MDKNFRLFGKISVVDLFVVILILGVAAGTFYRFFAPSASVTSGEKQIEYVLKIEGVRTFTQRFYEEGQNCYEKLSGGLVGKISGIRFEPYQSRITNDDGSMKMITNPNLMTVYLTITADGRETDEAFYANSSFRLKAGGAIPLLTKYISVSGAVESVKAK